MSAAPAVAAAVSAASGDEYCVSRNVTAGGKFNCYGRGITDAGEILILSHSAVDSNLTLRVGKPTGRVWCKEGTVRV